MTQPASLIHILPPQLANQIAAGEVVERPASVVKELVENSLDAGATLIQIEIEKGGAQLIRIRDNGCGIGKQDLALALARHATSKISSLEDLEAILSLGFRGEALASISSVSRLTLTSRPEYQAEAWQAYAQGREMEVEIQPASHPVGTTIEVANLFFNTPARRKFLRTDKTEFAHIDEVVRRIALAKPTVTFILSHNQKKVRHYKAVSDNSVAQQQKRVAAICGEAFIQEAVHLDWQHNELHLYGWIGSPQSARAQNDLNYSYVNGRMMRDKTINHAIRQAYGDQLEKESYPAFVLFLDLDPSIVDVNVHPAKHEVRFHQGRLVHDFIYQGVLNALESHIAPPLQKNCVNEPLADYHQVRNRTASGQNIFTQSQSEYTYSPFRPRSTPALRSDFSARTAASVNKTEQRLYQELLQPQETEAVLPVLSTPTDKPNIAAAVEKVSHSTTEATQTTESYLHALALVENRAVLVKQGDEFSLISLEKLARLKWRFQLEQGERQALLIPLSLRLNESQQQHWLRLAPQFVQLGFEVQVKQWQGETRLMISHVPSCLREQNLQQLIYQLLNQQAEEISSFFAKQLPISTACHLAEVIAMLTEIERFDPNLDNIEALKRPVSFTELLQSL